MKTINFLFALLTVGLIGATILGTLENIFGIEKVFTACVIIVFIASLYVIYLQIKNRRKKCTYCNCTLTKHNTTKDLFYEDVCDKEECLLEAWNNERLREMN